MNLNSLACREQRLTWSISSSGDLVRSAPGSGQVNEIVARSKK
jgi:hypothetical protein